MNTLRLVDLSLPLHEQLSIYSGQGYSDPPFRCSPWCSIADQGFRVSRLELGTQTGTHIDAPAHFSEMGATLESLPLAELMGFYRLVDLPAENTRERVSELLTSFTAGDILFIRITGGGTAQISTELFQDLLRIPTRVWVLAGEIEISDSAPLTFHRMLAEAGKFLVENLHLERVGEIGLTGEISAIPLAFQGVSGSPCRVFVRCG